MHARMVGTSLAALFAATSAAAVHAQVTLQPGSTVSATAQDYIFEIGINPFGGIPVAMPNVLSKPTVVTQGTTTNDVNSLPYTTPTIATMGTASSTVLSNLTTGGFSFNYNQSFTDPFSYTNGTGDIFFQAGPNVSYSIQGSATLTGDYVTSDFDVHLLDQTTNTYLYNYSNTANTDGQTLTLDNTGGSLTGTLTQGDVYEYFSSLNLQQAMTDPSVVGNSSITFTQSQGCAIPLPPAAWTGATFLAGMIGFTTLRRKIIA